MATSVYTSLLAKDYRRKLGDIALLHRELRDLGLLIRQRQAEADALKTILFGRDGAPPVESLKPIRTMPRVTSLSHEEKAGDTAEAIADLLSQLGEMVELSVLEDCDATQRLQIANDLAPAIERVQAAGLKIYGATRSMKHRLNTADVGLPLTTGYVRITSEPMKKFVFERPAAARAA